MRYLFSCKAISNSMSKAKRFVKFTPAPEGVKGKKGAKRRGQVDIDAEELGRFGGRVGGGVRFGRTGRGVPKKRRKEVVLETEPYVI